MVPLTPEALSQSVQASQAAHGPGFFEVGARMRSSAFRSFTLRNIESSMLEKQRCERLLKSANEALITFTTELKRIKKVIMAAVLANDETAERQASDPAGSKAPVNTGSD